MIRNLHLSYRNYNFTSQGVILMPDADTDVITGRYSAKNACNLCNR